MRPNSLIRKVYNKGRIAFYRLLSDAADVKGTFKAKQAVLLTGPGSIHFAKGVKLGVTSSPYQLSTYCYIEARRKESAVRIGNHTCINNNAAIISDGAGIEIGDDVLIGTSVQIYDSDFHTIDPARRSDIPQSMPVKIGNNVFIGASVTILKGVEIGDNSVIASNAVVVANIPADSVAAGNPAKVIRSLSPSSNVVL